MRDNRVSKQKTYNPITRANHRRQVFWQITVPLLLAILIIIAFAVLAVMAAAGGSNKVSTWADISIIWLIIPSVIGTLILTVLIGAVAYGVIKLIGILPDYAAKALNFLITVQIKARQASNSVAQPIVKTGGFFAAVNKFLGK